MSTAQPLTRVTHLNLSEWFGPTIQGEGPHAGQYSSFIRLAGCNLTCSWCDSKYTWDWENYSHHNEVHATTLEDTLDIIDNLGGRIIITGGEPLLQAPALARVLSDPTVGGRRFDLETNGTRPLGATSPWWDTIICSPKVIPSADQGPVAHRLDPSITGDHRTHFKFVIQDADDLAAVDYLAATTDWMAEAAMEGRVWFMPEGVTTDALTERTPFVINAAVERGVNFSSRLHVYGWHDVRGH